MGNLISRETKAFSLPEKKKKTMKGQSQWYKVRQGKKIELIFISKQQAYN